MTIDNKTRPAFLLCEALIDVFAGRIFEGMPNRGVNEALAAFQRPLERERP